MLVGRTIAAYFYQNTDEASSFSCRSVVLARKVWWWRYVICLLKKISRMNPYLVNLNSLPYRKQERWQPY